MEFVFNNLAYFIMSIVVLVSACSLMAAHGTMPNKRERFNFYCLMFIALVGLGGIIFTADIFTLYLFIEVTALASFVMITQGRNARAYEGTFKYLLLSVIASVFMLTGVALTLLFAHGTTFIEIRSAAIAGGANFLPVAALAFFVAGLFIKGGVVPFHGWVPDAYSSAPKAVSVFLAGIVTKVSGIYVLIRLLTLGLVAPPRLNMIFFVFGTLSFFVGALAGAVVGLSVTITSFVLQPQFHLFFRIIYETFLWTVGGSLLVVMFMSVWRLAPKISAFFQCPVV